MSHIILVDQSNTEEQTISLDQYIKKRKRRRKRVSRRNFDRFPLFAVEFTKEEFPGYSQEDLDSDLHKRKARKKIKGRSQMKRQGRYWLMKEHLTKYWLYGNIEDLRKAQQLRNRLFSPFIIEYRRGRDVIRYTFPSTTSVSIIQKLIKIQFTDFVDLEKKVDEITQYIHLS
jgi:hypothetical protein